MSRLSCVVPAYNEAESWPHFWPQLQAALQSFSDWEVVVVSDGSTDRTVSLVQQAAAQEQRLRCIPLRQNRGKSAALMAGFAALTGDIIVTLDADLQDDPKEISHLVKALEEQDLDMIGGWKQDRHDPFIKVLSSKVFNGLANRALRTNFHDLNCGLKVFRRAVTDELDLYGDLYRFIPLLAVALGWRVGEQPVVHHPRQYGQSKYGLRLNGVFDLISLLMITKYRERPLHFFGRWGGILLLIGLVMLSYLAIAHFRGQAIGDRPLLVFGVLFVVSGLQLLFTGLLGDLIVQRLRKQ